MFKQFEKGQITLYDYLVFNDKREFTEKDYIDFMYSQLKKIDSTIKLLEKLNARKEDKIASINNESFELNNYRIKKFDLWKYFDSFFSSCYFGVRKPEPEIFKKALRVLHKGPNECLFIDDREENFQSALTVSMKAILLEDASELENKLIELKIHI